MRCAIVAVIAGCTAGWIVPGAGAAEHFKPYRIIAVTLPQPETEPSFAAFRAKLGDAARQKDRAALAALVNTKDFFWDREAGSPPTPAATGPQLLDMAFDLTRADSTGWSRLAGYAAIARLAPAPGHDGALCTPPYPLFKDSALNEAMRATGTEVTDWGAMLAPDVPVRAHAAPQAHVIGKLGQHLVRLLSDPDDAGASSAVRIAMPSGRAGYIDGVTVAAIGSDQLCYVKNGDEWTIGGYIGAGDTP